MLVEREGSYAREIWLLSELPVERISKRWRKRG